MLALATGLLGIALLSGAGVAVAWLRRNAGTGPAWFGYAHATIAIAGYAMLLLALPGAHQGQATGTQSFGVIAAALIGAALLAGLTMLRARLRKRPIPGVLVGAHATLAVAGFVILAVYALLG
jgi:hypothetical protein